MEHNHPAHHRLGHSLFMSGVFLLLIGVTLLAPISTQFTRAFGVSDIVLLSNQARTQLNQSELAVSTKLMSAAQSKADDMAKQRYFAHVAPDGKMAWDYMRDFGYTYQIAGENLAITNENAQDVINGWLNSPTHRANLLSTDYRDFGIGLAPYGDYEGNKNTFVIVAMYGSNAPKQIAAAPTNPSGTSGFFKPQISGIPLSALIATAATLMVAGAALELRHLRRIHVMHHTA